MGLKYFIAIPLTNLHVKAIVCFKKGIFYHYFIQHCFTVRPSNSTVSEDAGIELRQCRSNHSAGLDLTNICYSSEHSISSTMT